MKKALSLILILALICALSGYALAETPTGGSTTITATVGDSYIVQIPEATPITFNTLKTDLTALKLTTAHLAPGKCVKVTATHTPLTMTGTGNEGNTIAYVLKSGETVFNSAQLTNTTDQTPLSIVIEQAAWDAAKSGRYSSTITFTYSYVDLT